MLERYEIIFHPIGQEDPEDQSSEAYQERAYIEASRRNYGVEGAIDEQYLSQVVDRAYLVVVKGRTKLVKVLRSPPMGDFPFEDWNTAMVEVIHNTWKEYPAPEYARAFGGHCLLDALRTFPLVINHRQIPIEQIILTPKQPSALGMPS